MRPSVKCPPSVAGRSVEPRLVTGGLGAGAAPRLEPGPHKRDRSHARHQTGSIPACPSTTRSRTSTTRGRAASSRTSTFYVEEARRSGGPVVELGVGTGRIAVPIARERDRGDRRRLLGGDARGRARARGARGRRARPAPRRPARPAGRGHVPARDRPVPLAAAHGDRRRPARRAARRAPRCSSPAAGSSSTSSRPAPDDISRDARPLARARAGHLRARRLGRGRADAHPAASAAAAPRPRSASRGSRSPSGACCSREEGFAVEGLYGWFDRTPVGRARGLDLGLPARLKTQGAGISWLSPFRGKLLRDPAARADTSSNIEVAPDVS